MKKRNLYFIIIALILFIAILTNPDSTKHKEAVKNKLHEYLQQKIQEHASGNALQEAGGALGSMFADVLVDRVVNNVVSSDSYLIFSTTKITWGSNSKVIGFGIFGHIFITGNVKDAIDRGLDK